MPERDYEARIKDCYSTWSTTYYDEYYGDQAPYPPLHRDLIKRLLREANIKSLLDAGCGPASFVRELAGEDIDLYGFDLTPEMVVEAKRVMQEKGFNPDHFWEGSVTDPAAYAIPGSGGTASWDAIVCSGVVPHIPVEADSLVIRNLHDAAKPGGLVIVEARNQLFALFTMNRYSYEFIVQELIQPDDLPIESQPTVQEILSEMQQHFRMDLPPTRKGKADEPGYDEVLSRTHNPLVLRERFEAYGFTNIQLLYYHYHALPPMFANKMPDFFRQQSMAMENPMDWRGTFMASAFLITGQRA